MKQIGNNPKKGSGSVALSNSTANSCKGNAKIVNVSLVGEAEALLRSGSEASLNSNRIKSAVYGILSYIPVDGQAWASFHKAPRRARQRSPQITTPASVRAVDGSR
jgi:hypothetical protein